MSPYICHVPGCGKPIEFADLYLNPRYCSACRDWLHSQPDQGPDWLGFLLCLVGGVGIGYVLFLLIGGLK